MKAPSRVLVSLLAALAARPPPRRAGLDAYIPAMAVAGLILAMPVFVALLTVIRVATRAHPLSADPLLSVALDSVIAGMMISGEAIRRWRPLLDEELALYDALTKPARWRRRGRALALTLLATLALASAVVLVVTTR